MALSRSGSDRVLAGVLGGVAASLGWNSTLVRLLYLLFTVCTAFTGGVVIYVLLALILPEMAADAGDEAEASA